MSSEATSRKFFTPAARIYALAIICVAAPASAPIALPKTGDGIGQDSPGARSCRPRIVRTSGVQRGEASHDLLRIGNVNCIEAQYDGVLRVEVEVCDGQSVALQGIRLERNGFANGRRWSSNPPITYELVYAQGNRSIPQPFGRGFGPRHVSFPPQAVRGVAISIPSRRSRGYQIYEQLCSISFDIAN